MPAIEAKKPVPALQCLHALHSLSSSPKFIEYLETLKTPKDRTLDALIVGIEAFMRVANFNSTERADFFGNSLLGLHYNNDLAKLWNSESPDVVQAHQLNHLCPPGWDYALGEEYYSLIYRGNIPSVGLDQLLRGPTVIDCAVFCQLSIWFGIRYMLGDQIFNQVFGNTPFYLTQLIYGSIDDPQKPYLGNPLYPFFTSEITLEEKTVTIVHLSNDPLYQFKHPGGNYGGENCIVINGIYTIFDPHLAVKFGLKKNDVERLLLDTLNAPQNVNDKNRLSIYSEKDPSLIHQKLSMNFGILIGMAQSLADFEIDENSWKIGEENRLTKKIQFDFKKFNHWIDQMTNDAISTVNYTPLKDEQLHIASLVKKLPFENRNNISFDNFKTETLLQKELFFISLKFCRDVRSKRSCTIVLTGKAGIGKTASAAICAKELVSRGKKVVWISEVTVRGWADQATTMQELENCRNQVKSLLAVNPDAVFLDDDNLVGYAGQVLLEEIYLWYTCHPGKGLFITSNEAISFQNCYGWQFDETYYFPPFPGYTSEGYQNTVVRLNLSGMSLRSMPMRQVNELSGDEKIDLIQKNHVEQSVGIIIDAKTYETRKNSLGPVEFIPAFSERLLLGPMRMSLKETGTLGPHFDQLSEHQKSWLRRFETFGVYVYYPDGSSKYNPPGEGVGIRPFEGTQCDMIVIEITQEYFSVWERMALDSESVAQLLRVVNYAHDHGEKKVVIVNRTDFSHQQLIKEIQEEIPERERERTIARIENLLFSSKLMLGDTMKKRVRNENNHDLFFFFLNVLKIYFSIIPLSKRERTIHELWMNFWVDNRHRSSEWQREYDKRFGLICRS